MMNRHYHALLAVAIGTSTDANDCAEKIAAVLHDDNPDFDKREFYRAIAAARLLMSIDEAMGEDDPPDDGITVSLGLN